MKKLLKSEMKKMTGGNVEAIGTCCVHTIDGSEWLCGISKSEARGMIQGIAGWKWCCDSCFKIYR